MTHDSRGPGLFMVCCFVSFAFFNFPPVLHSGQRVATLHSKAYTYTARLRDRDSEITDHRSATASPSAWDRVSVQRRRRRRGRRTAVMHAPEHAAARLHEHAAPPRGAQTPASALPLGKLFTLYDSMSYGNHSRNKGIKSRTRAPHTPDTRTRTHVTPNHQTLTVDA